MACRQQSPTYSFLSIPETKSHHLCIMMRLLSRVGIFKFHINPFGEESFGLAPVSRLLTTAFPDSPCSSPLILLLLNHHLVDPCHQLSRWFRRSDTSTTPFEMANGKKFWDLTGAQPEFNDLFNKGMTCDSVIVMDVLKHVGREAFKGIGTLVDVGGGTGLTAATLAKEFPGLKCTVFDLPHVVNSAKKIDGIQYVGGDMFLELPPADVALLKSMATSDSINLTNAEVQDILEAHEVLWNHTLSYIKSMCLKCAIELRIPDAILSQGMPSTISYLLSFLSIPETKSRHLRIMMRLLSRIGIFKSHITPSGEEAFSLAPVSQLLTTALPDSPCSSPLILLLLDHHLVDPCHQLSRWFHRSDTSTTPFEMAHGKTFWDLTGAQPEFNDLFNKGMTCDSVIVMDVLKLVGREAFNGIGTLVDVGGGTGLTAATLAKEFPGLKCTVFDLPHVVKSAKKIDGIQYVGGDMFLELPHADVALLKWILHDWSDEDCVRILQRCKEAIPPKEKGGKVIVIDMVVGVGINTQTAVETQLLFDLEMMILLTGKERDENEWHELFVAAGFSNYKITSTIGLRSIIEVYP
ncbi:hypothetical protein IEQ34_021304 [Dendrobium chrysotoxum]|uniref:Uncharacterized protein n=1 Tax=Dendrobium chrysotoxum TaxID=161865 RepID=A0AAV7G350_DENCH|nr:hypothetical protein IEQ34_021304 [Dendrobium chrysotoxum]